MEQLASSIAKYIEYLREQDLSVSIHFSADTLKALTTELYSRLQKYNYHSNPYCIQVKKNDHHRCIESQQQLIKEGCSGCRTCYAGVKEYITPIIKDGTPVGIIAISGYKGDGVEVQNKELWNSSLSSKPFPAELADTLIAPLKVMLEKLLEKDFLSKDSEYNLILQYLGEYYVTANLESICRHFHRSHSHISHIFKKNSGMSIRSYCNLLKLEASKKLLLKSNMTITQIAFESGFNDSSHFINLFKKKYGISPRAMRELLQRD